MNSFKAIMVVLVCTPIVQLWAGPDTALHRAARANNAGQAVQRLLNTEQGRRCINYRGFFARTPLHYAAQLGNEAVVQMLLAANARVDVTDNAGRTPLHHAVREGHLKVISKLVGGGASEELADKDGKTPLDYVIALDDVLLARAFFGGMVVDSGHDGGNTLLHEAASAGRQDVVERLTRQDSPQLSQLDKQNDIGQGALHCAVGASHVGIVDRLCTVGARVNSRDKKRFTPLYVAAIRKDATICRRLLDAGAEVDQKASHSSATALHGAFDLLYCGDDNGSYFGSGNGSYSVASVLLAAGASVNAQTPRGETPLHWAVSKNHTAGCRLLIEHGADVNRRANSARETPLHMALRMHCFDLYCLLISARADLSVQDRNAQTPLHVAVMHDLTPACALLLEGNLDVIDARDERGKTALDLAVMRGNYEVACLLIARGAGSGAGCDKLLAQTKRRQNQAFRRKVAKFIVNHYRAMAHALPTELPQDVVDHVLLPYALPSYYQEAQQLHRSATSRARKRQRKRKGAGPATGRAEKKGRS